MPLVLNNPKRLNRICKWFECEQQILISSSQTSNRNDYLLSVFPCSYAFNLDPIFALL